MQKSRIFLLGLVMLVTVGMIYGYSKIQKPEKEESSFAVVNELHQLITDESVYPISSDALIEGALRGMAGAINDPYSTYYSKQEALFHKQALASERVGIGLELSEVNGKFIVVAPVKASPAEKAGIRPLDELVQVNDTRLDGKKLSDVMKLMQGKEGEVVTLVLFRPELDRHVKLEVKREKLKNTTVETQVHEVEGVKIGHIIVSLFAEKTAEEWKNALDGLMKKEVQGYIIDVRDNPGGYLHSVAQMVSMFMQKGTIFAYMQNHEGAMEPLTTIADEAFAPYIEHLNNVPVTVLQNEGSASASEVFSGALQDWKRAVVIGVTSFGKGTVQKTWPLTNGGEVKLSTNKWLTPSKRWIHEVGIDPDLEITQHPLYSIEMKLLKGRFEVGEYGEEIAYSQRVLQELGYNIGRTDGFFDVDTANEVEKFRKHHDLQDGRQLDEVFFRELTMQVKRFKEDPVNDMQLQMAISFIMHQFE